MLRRRPGEASDMGVLQQESGTFVFVKDAWIKPCTRLSWKKTCILLLWFFQQDNAPFHTARLTLNLTENLWNVIKRKMVTSHQQIELLEFLRQEWHKVNWNVKEWWRACQDAWKWWLKIRVIPPNIYFWTSQVKNISTVLFTNEYELVFFSLLRSENIFFVILTSCHFL